jgi:hypothetical protein
MLSAGQRSHQTSSSEGLRNRGHGTALSPASRNTIGAR